MVLARGCPVSHIACQFFFLDEPLVADARWATNPVSEACLLDCLIEARSHTESPGKPSDGVHSANSR